MAVAKRELTVPLTWAEVRDLVHRGTHGEPDALGYLERSVPQLAVYRSHRARVLEEYASVGDNLRARLFGAPVAPGPDGKLAVATPDPTAEKPYLLVMANEFPYFLEPGVVHINIWCSAAELTDAAIEALIAERLPADELVWFVNPPQYQSVRTIWHCHVMLRNLKPHARLSKPGEAELLDPVKYPIKG